MEQRRNSSIHPSAGKHRATATWLHRAIDSLKEIEGLAKDHYSRNHPVRVRCDKATAAVRWLQAELANAAIQEYPGEGLANAYTTAKSSVDVAEAMSHVDAGMGSEIGLD